MTATKTTTIIRNVSRKYAIVRFWQPAGADGPSAVVAKQSATIDHISGGRFRLNVVDS